MDIMGITRIKPVISVFIIISFLISCSHFNKVSGNSKQKNISENLFHLPFSACKIIDSFSFQILNTQTINLISIFQYKDISPKQIIENLLCLAGRPKCITDNEELFDLKDIAIFRDKGKITIIDKTIGFVMIKPDGYDVKDQIIKDIEDNHFKVLKKEESNFKESAAEKFYAEHKERTFFPFLKNYITGKLKQGKENPVVKIIFQYTGNRNMPAWQILREEVIGQTDGEKKGTLRNKYHTEIVIIDEDTKEIYNKIHCSGEFSEAAREIGILFPAKNDLNIVGINKKELLRRVQTAIIRKIIKELKSSRKNIKESGKSNETIVPINNLITPANILQLFTFINNFIGNKEFKTNPIKIIKLTCI
ncbi:nucleoside-diphosphate kinase [bacterium]